MFCFNCLCLLFQYSLGIYSVTFCSWTLVWFVFDLSWRFVFMRLLKILALLTTNSYPCRSSGSKRFCALVWYFVRFGKWHWSGISILIFQRFQYFKHFYANTCISTLIAYKRVSKSVTGVNPDDKSFRCKCK